MNTDRVAIIIVNYNSGDFLGKCLAGLRNQTRQPDRVLIVDNASRDGSLDTAANTLPQAEIIRLDTNQGFGAANNLGVNQSEDCQWVVLLNPDTVPEPDWLEYLIQAAADFPDYSTFGSHMTDYDQPARMDGTGDVYHVSGMAWRRDFGRFAERATRDNDEIFSPSAAAAMYKRDVFLEAGGLDEAFFTYFEDLDLGFRLRLLGHRSLHVAQARVAHKGWSVTGRTTDFYIYHAHRNLVWTYFKNMPGFLFWKHLPQHITLNLFSLIWFSLKGNLRSIWKAKWDALRALPKLWRQRKSLQNSRNISPESLEPHLARGWWTPITRRYR